MWPIRQGDARRPAVRPVSHPGAEEAGGDRCGDGAAGAAALDEDGKGKVATVAGEPGVGRQRVAGAELGAAGA